MVVWRTWVETRVRNHLMRWLGVQAGAPESDPPARAVNHDIADRTIRRRRSAMGESSDAPGRAVTSIARSGLHRAPPNRALMERSDRSLACGRSRPGSPRSERDAGWDVESHDTGTVDDGPVTGPRDDAASLRVRRAVHRVKHLGVVDLAPLRTFTPTELIEFQAALRSGGGVRTTTERVIDRLILRRRRAELRRRAPASGESRGTERQCPTEAPAWLIALLVVSLTMLGMIVLVTVP